MENDKLFELMTKMYSEMQEGFSKVETRIDGLETRLDKVDNIVTNIEYTHTQKLEALFDGYIQNKQQLDRIEQEVSQREEIVLRRIQ